MFDHNFITLTFSRSVALSDLEAVGEEGSCQPRTLHECRPEGGAVPAARITAQPPAGGGPAGGRVPGAPR